ncbi:MAG: hypothetical protein JXR63_09330 [Spirochaetales bacterium]|nr:hypothetical protein [Spirochaetales bacterium]
MKKFISIVFVVFFSIIGVGAKVEVDFAIPADFEKLVRYMEDNNLESFFDEYLNFIISLDDEDRGYNMVPEFFPVAYMGCDGVCWGYMNFTPEIEADDYPMVMFSPTDSDCYSLEGLTTNQALIRIFSLSYEAILYYGDSFFEARKNEKKIIKLYKELFNTKITEKLAYEIAEEIIPFSKIAIPSGYTKLDTSDGLFIIVPDRYVDKKESLTGFDIENYDILLQKVNVYMSEELYGNAFYLIREYNIRTWFDDKCKANNNKLNDLLKVVYQKLNREVLIKNIEYF